MTTSQGQGRGCWWCGVQGLAFMIIALALDGLSLGPSMEKFGPGCECALGPLRKQIPLTIQRVSRHCNIVCWGLISRS